MAWWIALWLMCWEYLVQFMIAPLLMWLLANALGKMEEDGPRVRLLPPIWETQMLALA